MANRTVSILVPFKEGVEQRTGAATDTGKTRLNPGIGLDKDGTEFPCRGGIYWIR